MMMITDVYICHTQQSSSLLLNTVIMNKYSITTHYSSESSLSLIYSPPILYVTTSQARGTHSHSHSSIGTGVFTRPLDARTWSLTLSLTLCPSYNHLRPPAHCKTQGQQKRERERERPNHKRSQEKTENGIAATEESLKSAPVDQLRIDTHVSNGPMHPSLFKTRANRNTVSVATMLGRKCSCCMYILRWRDE